MEKAVAEALAGQNPLSVTQSEGQSAARHSAAASPMKNQSSFASETTASGRHVDTSAEEADFLSNWGSGANDVRVELDKSSATISDNSPGRRHERPASAPTRRAGRIAPRETMLYPNGHRPHSGKPPRRSRPGSAAPRGVSTDRSKPVAQVVAASIAGDSTRHAKGSPSALQQRLRQQGQQV